MSECAECCKTSQACSKNVPRGSKRFQDVPKHLIAEQALEQLNDVSIFNHVRICWNEME